MFWELNHIEAFYGGAAGGGKSDALIATALKYIHVPGYRAIIFRRTAPRLDDLIERTHEWWSGKAYYNQTKMRWTFPTGGDTFSSIRFGHMQHESDKFNYKGPAFQFIGWDELTEFLRSQYTYLFSRLRRPSCQMHKSARMADCATCRQTWSLSQVPLCVRGASNPDGDGLEWVKERLVSNEAADAISSGTYGTLYWNIFEGKRIPFVPSRVEDNPGLDQDAYINGALANVDPLSRIRLRVGDWKVRADGLMKPEWIRRYSTRGNYLSLRTGESLINCDDRECTRFATIDTAGTSEDKAKEKRGKPPSWSVMAIWDLLPSTYGRRLVLRHVWRKRVGFTDLLKGILETFATWQPSRVLIEDKHVGPAVADSEQIRAKMRMEFVSPGQKDKATRAATFLNMLEAGEVYIPDESVPGAGLWLSSLEAEWLSWQGHPDETADQIDVASYAAMHCTQSTASWGGTISPSAGRTRRYF